LTAFPKTPDSLIGDIAIEYLPALTASPCPANPLAVVDRCQRHHMQNNLLCAPWLVISVESPRAPNGGLRAGQAASCCYGARLCSQYAFVLACNKNELELGQCLRLRLRLRQEGPCECDIYLTCAKFVTTPQYAPRLREGLCLERQLADDAQERSWPR
jgi:hypothetical protein